MSPTPAEGDRTVLQRDVSHFLVDFSIALHRLVMYPRDHPALVPALETLARRADALLQDRGQINLGIARDRLVIEGVVTDVRHPLLRGLAERLHRHHLAALSFRQGVSMPELADFITALAEDPDRSGRPLGRRASGTGPAWPHVGLHALTLSGLDIVGGPESGATPARGADLWVGLAKAALEQDADGVPPALAADPAVVARAIDERHRAEAYDQVVVGYLLEIAAELRAPGGSEAVELRRRVSTLVSAVHPETLRRLLDMGGHALQRRRFLQDAAVGMTGRAVVDLVKAAAETANETVSSGLLRLLTKLAVHTDAGSANVRPLADVALRRQVERLIGSWDLPDPNPREYTVGLDTIARGVSPTAAPVEAGSLEPLSDPVRVVEVCLAVDEDGPALRRALDAATDDGALGGVIDALDWAGGGEEVVHRAREHLASADTVRRLLATVPPDFAGVDRLIPCLEGEALSPLFDVLFESTERHVRRAVFDRLRSAGSAAAAPILARMGDPRWYVIRNLLALLADLELLPAEFDPSPWLAHDDGRVRREALRVALRVRALHDGALVAGLADSDSRVLRVAVTAALERCPPAGARRLRDLAGEETLDDDLRAIAVAALVRASRAPDTLDLLLRLASRDGRVLWRPTLAAKSQTVLAALGGLASAWPRDPRAALVVRQAAASSDPGIRRAVGAEAT